MPKKLEKLQLNNINVKRWVVIVLCDAAITQEASTGQVGGRW